MSDIQVTARCSACLSPVEDFFILSVQGKQMVFCPEDWADFASGVDEQTAHAIMDAIDDFKEEETLVNTVETGIDPDELLLIALDVAGVSGKKRDRIHMWESDGSYVMASNLPAPFEDLSDMFLGETREAAVDTLAAFLLGMRVFEQSISDKKSKKGKKK